MSDAVFATENAVQPVDMLPAEAHGGIDVPLSKQQNDDFHAHILSRGYTYNGEGYVHDVRAFDIFATENSAPQTSEHMEHWTEQTRLPSPQPVGMHTILPTIQNIMHSNSSDAIPIVTTGEETMSGGTAFHECMSPPIRAENSPREEPRETPPASPARNSDIRSDATGNIVEQLLSDISPTRDFPIPAESVWYQAKAAKKGDEVIVAWTFDRQSKLNVSIGTVKQKTSRGKHGKVQVEYVGLQGHSQGQSFYGVLPPHENVRVYKLLWTDREFTEGTAEIEQTTAVNHTEKDLDLEPLPTMRTISPEFVPGVVTIFRDIIRDYADSNYEYRNRIWHRLMSATKHSLATIREKNGRKRRKRPQNSDDISDSTMSADNLERSDIRAMKKAIRLVLDGCTSKASKVIDIDMRKGTLSDAEVMTKLRDLHPQLPCTFNLPSDAPAVACFSTVELREAGKRLSKGAAPGPSRTTDGVLRLLLDDEICCSCLCHMIKDLVNGNLSKDVMHRLKRARLLALPKPDNKIRPIAMGEIILKLAGILLLQRYEKTLPPLFAPFQYGVMMKNGCEKVIHELTDLYNTGHAILSVDLTNAFNSPSRDEIAKCVFGMSTLRPFRRIFTAEYAEPSELLFYGADGKFAGTIQSSAGVRQGSPLSTLYFCAMLQPILETLAEEFPGVQIFAFVDDINMASRDGDLLAKAFERLRSLLLTQIYKWHYISVRGLGDNGNYPSGKT